MLIDEQIFHTENIQLPSYIKLTIDPIYFLLYSTSNFLRCVNGKICNQQWFEFEGRMLKMPHKWEFFYTPNIHHQQYIKEMNSPLMVL